MKKTSAVLPVLLWASIATPTGLGRAATALALTAPVTVELSHMFADGGTLGGTLTDADGKSLKFCYDGRQTFASVLPWHKYHLFVGAYHPSDAGARELAICSETEVAVYALVEAWVANTYPADWRDSGKYASAGYVVRFLDDMAARNCESAR